MAQRGGIAARQVIASEASGEEGVAAQQCAVREKADRPRGVPGGMQHRQADTAHRHVVPLREFAGYLYRLDLQVGHEHRPRRRAESFRIQCVHEHRRPSPARQLRRLGHVIEVAVGADDRLESMTALGQRRGDWPHRFERDVDDDGGMALREDVDVVLQRSAEQRANFERHSAVTRT